MKNSKQKLVYVFFVLIALMLAGCAVTQPSEPLNGKVKFDKITLNFIQKHIPRTKQYQSKYDVESKLNNEIIKNLELNNMLDANSIDELVITIDFRRIFMGEEMPFEKMRSDTIGSPKIGYDISIIKNGKILRGLSRTNLSYDAGFLKNLKHIAMMDKENERENEAIEALAKDITEQIKKFK